MELLVFARLSCLIAVFTISLLGTQVPQVNLTVIITSCQLINIGQVTDALDVIIDKPGRVFSPVRDVLLSLLVSSNLLLATTWPLLPVLIGNVFRVTELKLVVARKELLYVPGKDGTLGTS